LLLPARLDRKPLQRVRFVLSHPPCPASVRGAPFVGPSARVCRPRRAPQSALPRASVGPTARLSRPRRARPSAPPRVRRPHRARPSARCVAAALPRSHGCAAARRLRTALVAAVLQPLNRHRFTLIPPRPHPSRPRRRRPAAPPPRVRLWRRAARRCPPSSPLLLDFWRADATLAAAAQQRGWRNRLLATHAHPIEPRTRTGVRGRETISGASYPPHRHHPSHSSWKRRLLPCRVRARPPCRVRIPTVPIPGPPARLAARVTKGLRDSIVGWAFYQSQFSVLPPRISLPHNADRSALWWRGAQPARWEKPAQRARVKQRQRATGGALRVNRVRTRIAPWPRVRPPVRVRGGRAGRGRARRSGTGRGGAGRGGAGRGGGKDMRGGAGARTSGPPTRLHPSRYSELDHVPTLSQTSVAASGIGVRAAAAVAVAAAAAARRCPKPALPTHPLLRRAVRKGGALARAVRAGGDTPLGWTTAAAIADWGRGMIVSEPWTWVCWLFKAAVDRACISFSCYRVVKRKDNKVNQDSGNAGTIFKIVIRE
jgi:hypothetical protein